MDEHEGAERSVSRRWGRSLGGDEMKFLEQMVPEMLLVTHQEINLFL